MIAPITTAVASTVESSRRSGWSSLTLVNLLQATIGAVLTVGSVCVIAKLRPVASPEFDRTNPEPSMATAHDHDGSTPTPLEVERGSSIGRYVALARLGAGGMGVVWAAWDPELDREIAIKLLGRRLAGQKARDRLLREAQAMARLAHPNIVAVHDVGLVDGQVFVAMEYVRGQTLRQWQRERGWSEILDAYRQAALGLAAAHESGLVHRDFKPDNAMIDAQGRVRVMDFGLAAAYGGLDDPERWARDDLREVEPRDRHGEDEHAASDDPLAIERSTSDLLSTPLTEVGVVIGTPAFMGPEQLEGRGGGPGSDQFALCVSSWQALFGERPYPGDSIDALLDAIHDGRLRQPPATSKVPRRVIAALVRGLAADPSQRWPSMSELAEQLRPDREASSSWRMFTLLIVTLALVLAGLATRTQQPIDNCEGTDARLEGVWDDARADTIARALQRAGSHGGAAWSRVQPAVDAWVEQWLAVGVGACRGNDGLPEQLRVAQAVCLERSKGALEAALSVLERSEPEVAAHALDLVLGLPAPSRCSQPEWLAALDRRPAPTDLEAARALQRGLERAAALGDAGLHRDALAQLEPLRQRAAALGDRALHGELLDAIGLAQLMLDREADAIASLTHAYGELIRAGEDRSATKVCVRLMLAHQGLAQTEAGRAWDTHAAALLDRVESTAPDRRAQIELRADRLIALAALADGAGEYREALRLYREAIDLLESDLVESELGPGALRLGRMLDEFGAVHSRLGELDEAEAAELRSLAILTRNLGPEHPEVGGTHFKLGNTSFRKGDLEAARAHFEQAIAIVEPALGPASAAVTGSLTGLGATQLSTGDDAGAAQSFRAALERIETALGPEHPDLVPPLANLGIALKRANDFEGSEAAQLRALALLEQLRGREHPDLLAVLDNLGELRLLRGDPNGAREVYARSLAIGEKSFGVDHPELDYSLVGLGDAARALGELDEAARHYRRVLAEPQREGKNASLVEVAMSGLTLCD
jgi:serine/threonine protein kinase/tetratricopeptide (TPR) repeat protein